MKKYCLAKKWEQFKIVLLFMDHPVTSFPSATAMEDTKNILLVVVLSGNLKVGNYGRIAHSISFPRITHYKFVTFLVI